MRHHLGVDNPQGSRSINPRDRDPRRLSVKLFDGVGEFFEGSFHVVVFDDEIEKLAVG